VSGTPTELLALLRSRSYVALLALAAIIGVPVSAAAYFFLALVSKLQGWVFTSLPEGLGFHGEPLWWPVLPLALAGLLVALAIRHLPGKGGHSPADGFKVGAGPPAPVDLPGVILAALATLSLGVVLGPEAPMIALGGGLGVLAVRLVKRDAPPRTTTVVASAGSFAAISTLLGSPLIGAFLLMEAGGLSGTMLELVLVPGLLAAGIGSLIFIGLGAWTGLGTFSLAIPHLPHVGSPTAAEFAWALAIGVAAAPLGGAIRWLGLFLRPHVERRMVLITPLVGLAVAGLAIAFAAGTGKGSSEVLFSGQSALGPFITSSASYTVGALLLLMACKGLAYGVSLSSFRGGPTFPAMFLGGVGGVALSHLPGLPLVDGVAIGIGAMTVVMLRLPLTSVLLATLLLASDGLQVMPLVIVAVAVAYVASARLTPSPAPAADAAPDPAPAASPAPAGSPARAASAATGPPRLCPGSDDQRVGLANHVLVLVRIGLLGQHVAHGLEPGALLVVAPDHGPRSFGDVRAGEHELLGLGVAVPHVEGGQVDRAQLPPFHRIRLPPDEPAQLLTTGHREPELDQGDSIAREHPLKVRCFPEKIPVLLRRAEVHDPLDPGAVVPGPIEERDLAGAGQVPDVAAEIPVAALLLGG
jgi:H+/Cl- antiporter ClcA